MARLGRRQPFRPHLSRALPSGTITISITAEGASKWLVPAGVTSVVVEAWGFGGTGDDTNPTLRGGGGGSYAKSTITVTPGSLVDYNVGSFQGGDYSWFVSDPTFDPSSPCYAYGGFQGSSGGFGGNDCFGDVTALGGDGGSAGTTGGGGGGAAGSVLGNGAAGSNGSGSTGGAGGIGAGGAGSGGAGGNNGLAGVNGVIPGGGGGSPGSGYGGEPSSGGSGKLVLTYSLTIAGISFDASSNSGYQAASSSYSWSHTCSGANRYLVVGVSMLSISQTVSSVTYNSVGLSLLGSRSSITGACRVELWGLVAPVTGSNTVAVTLSGSIASAAGAVSFTGVNQTSSTESFNSAQATNGVSAADATVDVTTVADGDWCVDALATDDTAVTVGAGQTQRMNVTGVGGSGAMSTEGPKSPAGAVTMSWTSVGALATWAIGSIGLRSTLASSSQTASPGVGIVTVSGITPASSATGSVISTPGNAAVALSGIAPASSGTGTGTSTPGASTITLSGVAPASSGTGVGASIPGVATTTLTGAAPSSSGTGTATTAPGISVVTLTGVAPSSSGTGVADTLPSTSTVSLSGVSVSASATGSVTSTPDVATVTLTGLPPPPSGAGTAATTPDAATAALTGSAPSAVGSGSATSLPGFSSVTTTGMSPDVTGVGAVASSPGTGAIAISGSSPSSSGTSVAASTPGVGSVTTMGEAPTSTATGIVTVSPASSQVTLTISAPSASPSGSVTSTPEFGSVTLSGASPSTLGSGTGAVSITSAGLVAVSGASILVTVLARPRILAIDGSLDLILSVVGSVDLELSVAGSLDLLVLIAGGSDVAEIVDLEIYRGEEPTLSITAGGDDLTGQTVVWELLRHDGDDTPLVQKIEVVTAMPHLVPLVFDDTDRHGDFVHACYRASPSPKGMIASGAFKIRDPRAREL